MRKVVRLTESDLVRIVKRVIRESEDEVYDYDDDLIGHYDVGPDRLDSARFIPNQKGTEKGHSMGSKTPERSYRKPRRDSGMERLKAKDDFARLRPERIPGPERMKSRRDYFDLNENYDIDAILNPRSIKYSENPNVDDFLESVFPGLNTEDTKKALFKLLRNEELFREFSRLMRIFGYNSYHNKEEIFDKVIEWAYERGYPEEEY